ncbi:MAG: TonB-dependent receptor, partial [Halioglobus sp.]|nr:TonB-dependent receptor [Halioglobus sp.]
MAKNALLIFSLSLAASVNVFAQEISSGDQIEDPKKMEEIIIFGTKLGLTVQDSDVSVEVFDAMRLEREAIFDLDDVLLRSPNVAISGDTTSMTIRGINRNGASGGGQGVTSNVYVDGAPAASAALQFGVESVWDVAQVEVLRGPQSTVQGRNALAGSVVISTADPTHEWEIKSRLRAAQYNTEQYALAVSGPIVKDQLAFRIAVDKQSTDGFIDNVASGRSLDQDYADTLTVRSKLLIEPNVLPGLRIELIYEDTDSELGNSSSRVSASVPVTDPAFRDYDPTEGNTFADYSQNSIDVQRSIADIAYSLTDNLQLNGLFTYEEVQRDNLLGNLKDLSLFPNNGFNDDSVETFSAELSIQFNYDRLTGRVGTYYYESEDSLLFDVSAPFFDAIPNGIPGISLDPADSQIIARVTDGTQTDNYAFYAQFRYELSDSWTLAAGLRYDHEEFETTGLQNLLEIEPSSCLITVPGNLVGMPGSPGLSLACTAVLPSDEVSPPQAESYSAWLPRASITYHHSEDISIFLSVQRGYRAGGTYVQSTILDGIPVTLQESYDPEYLTNFELGLRTYYPDHALTINGSVFYSTLEDQQISLPGPTGNSLDVFTANVGETEIYGLELSSSYAATDSLNIYASLGLLHAEFTEFPFATQVPDSQFFTLNGNEPELAPGITFSIGMSYKHASGAFADVNV